eukprot:TRINITY_DN7295_c0_g1_i1.p1 TRINITY_DN7295_c0_g1~~TRINITY_DN7295_c0_g1_i1.p1  ORF type:complete len:415 (+),score=107.11 TRINITY_DN7295_c0_g1_i1:20-1264(+)
MLRQIITQSNIHTRKKSTLNRRSYTTSSLYNFTEDEVILKDTVARFAQSVVAPKVKEMDENSKTDPEIKAQLFEQGLMGIAVDSKYGGSGMGVMALTLAIEEMAKVDAGISLLVDLQNTVVTQPIQRYGTESQKDKYLEMLVTEKLGSFCLSEWGSGSDAFALKTTALKKGNEYVINGTKAWISNAEEAATFNVFANVDPSKGYKGITCFVVEANNPGVTVSKKEEKLGMRSTVTNEVIFKDCVVSESDIVGEEGKGYKIAIGSLNEGRVGIAAQMLGIAKGAFNNTLPYLTQRKQFGENLTSFQGIQFELAELATDIEAATTLVYNAARLVEEGKPAAKEAAIAKLYASRVAERVSSSCINLLGGVGFTKDFPVEKYFRDCKVGQIYEGTNNMQLQTISKILINDYNTSKTLL